MIILKNYYLINKELYWQRQPTGDFGPALAMACATNYSTSVCPLCCLPPFCPPPALAASGSSTNRWTFSTTSNPLIAMMTALLVLSMTTFAYLCYVLLKPEKF
ncbi:potassium-transporting ATPase subunit F [Microvirga sp. SRT04]|uniref:Potassium-transporting ATPase subunit F n=1 Tax=Hymenobacter properus TaxID=2791026 RepID=A0A931BJH8_9BACT|nr:potassium-transporting ATPase subunit F [Hymenobacter properus]MBR7722474.1 potassium-transporting ATPase subunit F [Microvirga sp. SRT04]